ncbi:MAG: TRAP transporter large permease [Phycisphaeraceae bacterium]|nr:TRAP transporter large permease [Phycisphaeraceae bacterium]
MDVAALILIVSFVLLLLMNVPVAFALGISTFLAIFSLGQVPTSYVVAHRMANGIDSFTLLAIPFFILAGTLMGDGGMARRLMDFASALMARFTGGLAYVNTLTCMLFGSISGSAAAAVSSIGGFMIPEMNRQRYDKHFNVSVTVSAATTGLVIPPSNIMIIYAVVAPNVSIAAMFMAGIIPGIVLGLFIMAAAAIISLGKGYGTGERGSIRQILTTGLGAMPSLGLIVIVLAGILGGVFSATEASAIAVLYAFLLGVVFYREIPLRRLPDILLRAGRTTAMVMLLIAASSAMSWFLAYERIPQAVSGALLALSENPIMILLLINLLLLLVGTFMDMTPAVLIFTPIFLPVALAMGIDPVHFGIIMIVNLCIGLCTPPVGTCLFVGCAIGRAGIVPVARAMLPFFLAMVLALLLITFLPALSLWLPRLMGQI